MARDIKQIWYLYQARRVNTQTNGAGGALTTRISMNAGQVGKIVQVYQKGSASATCVTQIWVHDEDGANQCMLKYTAAAANQENHLPLAGGTTYADSNGLLIGPGQFLAFLSSVVLNTETQTVGVALLLSTPVEPTWDTTGSVGTPSLAASTISAANTLQAVYL